MRRDAFAIDSSKQVANKAERFVPLTLPSGPCHGFCPFDDDPSWVETIHTRERPPSLKKLGRSDAEGAVQRDSYPLLHPEVNRSDLPRKDNVGLFGLDDAQVISLGEVSKATVNPMTFKVHKKSFHSHDATISHEAQTLARNLSPLARNLSSLT